MSTQRTLEYLVTFSFQFATITRTERARCVADAILKARKQIPCSYNALAITAIPKERA